MADFPAKLWSGRKPEREPFGENSPPNNKDWSCLVEEIQAMQIYLLTLSDNAQELPDIPRLTSATKAALDSITEQFEAFDQPGQIVYRLERLEERFQNESVPKSQIAKIGTAVKKLTIALKNLRSDHDRLGADLIDQMKSLTNAVRNRLTEFGKAQDEKLSELADKVRRLEDLQNPEF